MGERRGMPPYRDGPARRPGFGVGVLLAVVSVVLVATLTAAGGSIETTLARAVIVAVPFAVGLYAWSRGADGRYGLLLVAGAAALTLSGLAEASDPGVYTAGRVAGYAVEVLFITAVLSFPTGRLGGTAERRVVLGFIGVVVVLFLPRLVLAERLEVPSPFTSCVTGCPGNPWFAFATEPAFVADVLRPAGALATMLATASAAILLCRRWAAGTPNVRRSLEPVLVVAVAFVSLQAVGIFARDALGREDLETAAWALAFRFPLLAAAFLAGPLRWRLFEGRSLVRLARSLEGPTTPTSLRRAFAEAFDDPDLTIVYPSASSPSTWLDASGRPVVVPADNGTRLTRVHRDGRLVAAIRHDEALLVDPELVAAGTAMASVVLDNQRLAASAEVALRDIRRSRDRLAASAEDERRRIERDLHDGAQQRLVALRIELGLAEDLVERDPEAAVRRLRRLEGEIDAALDDVRSLAHGVYPRVLADAGIAPALRAAGERVHLPVEVRAHGIGRFAPETESAVYFCLLEGLQNVLKHAPEARRVVIELRDGDGQLRFTLRDDGAGAPGGRIDAGAGITNMRDRLAAVGGEVVVESTPRVGTVVRGRVPVGTRAA